MRIADDQVPFNPLAHEVGKGGTQPARAGRVEGARGNRVSKTKKKTVEVDPPIGSLAVARAA
jgi:hypothetical protein